MIPATVFRPTEATDRELLERFAQRGAEDAFAILVRRHGGAVLAVCRRLLRHEQDAEDIAQAVFLVLARKSGQLDWTPSVRKWLCGVARRLALNARSTMARRRSREYLTVGDSAEMDPPSAEDSPLARVAEQELAAVVEDEIQQLPPKYRAPVMLCYLEGKSNLEAAALLGWPTGSMARRLGRARALLGQRLTRRGLAALVVFGIVLLAVGSAWLAAPMLLPQREPLVAQLMARFRPEAGEMGLGDQLAAFADGVAPLRLDRQTVGEMAAVAGQLRGHGPGGKESEWDRSADAMRQAALVLSETLVQEDMQAMRTAARNLHASCQQCHLFFRR